MKTSYCIFLFIYEIKFDEKTILWWPVRELGQGTPDVHNQMDVELEPSSGLHHHTWLNGTLLRVGDVMTPNIDRCRQENEIWKTGCVCLSNKLSNCNDIDFFNCNIINSSYHVMWWKIANFDHVTKTEMIHQTVLEDF